MADECHIRIGRGCGGMETSFQVLGDKNLKSSSHDYPVPTYCGYTAWGGVKYVWVFSSAPWEEEEDAAEGNGEERMSSDVKVLASGGCPGRKRSGEKG